MKKLKWGVIGAGGIARKRTIPGIMLAENAELTAIMDVNEVLLQKMAAEYQVKGYTTVEALLADPEVEAVYIASPVFAHLEQVRLAAAAGKHILLEKPMGRDTKECEEMIRICREAGVKGGVAFMMRFHTYHQQIRELIAAGTLGQIVSARAQQIFWYPDLPDCWRQQKALSGGGALMDVGVHNIDVIEYITGSRTRRVTGFTDTRTFHYDVDDCCQLLIQLENGAVAYIDGAFNMQGTPGGMLLEVYGTKGSILAQGTIGQVEGGTLSAFVTDENGERSELTLEPNFTNMYTKEVEAFSRAVIEDTTPPVPFEDGLWIQKVAEAAYRAQEEGRVVEVQSIDTEKSSQKS